MARTRDAILAELTSDPQYAELVEQIGDETIALDAAKRQARLEAWADALHAQELADDAVAAHAEMRVLVRRGLPVLEANLVELRDTSQTQNAAQIRAKLGDATKACIEIIQALSTLAQFTETPPEGAPE